MQQNEVELYFEGKYIGVGVNEFFAGGSFWTLFKQYLNAV